MKEIFIKETNASSEDYTQLLEFRNKWLRQPLGLDLMTEDLTDDHQDFILLVMEEDEIVGCLMLHPVDDSVIKFRQMAIHPRLQGKGIGSVLMADGEQLAMEQGYSRVVLHARQTAAPFYEKLGYQSTGNEFTEVTVPHIAMEKTLH
ncbi:MAG: N-acetyltransferase [Sphingobacteriales bacterium]|nr:MAG: N-acetyltransferase [Sphingobacteriales bacterium]